MWLTKTSQKKMQTFMPRLCLPTYLVFLYSEIAYTSMNTLVCLPNNDVSFTLVLWRFQVIHILSENMLSFWLVVCNSQSEVNEDEPLVNNRILAAVVGFV